MIAAMGGFRWVLASVAAAGALALAPAASAQTSAENLPEAPAGEPQSEPQAGDGKAQGSTSPPPAKARIRVALRNLRGGKLRLGRKVVLRGKLRPFRPGEEVTVRLYRRGKRIRSYTRRVKRRAGGAGAFKAREKLIKPGPYRFRVIHPKSDQLTRARARSRRFSIDYPKLRKGDRGKDVRLLNKLLRKRGYVTDRRKRKFNSRTADAVLAFRKVNKMSWRSKATSRVLRTLVRGKGAFNVKKPHAGRHVEVDISRQVMALIKKGRAVRTYHISTGAPSTPTIRGKYRFYMSQPGYNNIRMYYSRYFIRGYAIHGYHSVPKYPASHGCIRTRIREAKSIYKWIDIGMRIYTYD